MNEKQQRDQRERISRIEKSIDGDYRISTAGITTLSELIKKNGGDAFFIESKKHRGCYLHPRPKLQSYQLVEGRVGAAIFKLSDARELLRVTKMEDELEPVPVPMPEETN